MLLMSNNSEDAYFSVKFEMKLKRFTYPSLRTVVEAIGIVLGISVNRLNTIPQTVPWESQQQQQLFLQLPWPRLACARAGVCQLAHTWPVVVRW